MNSICKRILEVIKDHLQAVDKPLVEKIIGFREDINRLSLDNLLTDWNEGEDVAPAQRQPSADIVQQPVTIQQNPLDFRIKSLTLQNFRTYPEHVEQPYGLSFVKRSGEEPCSLFLVGKNGTGKSTIFDALEWIYTGIVRNAENRGVHTPTGLKSYLTYGFGSLNNISSDSVLLKVERTGTVEEWGLDKKTPLCVPAICCSDMDIEEISKFGEDVQETVGNIAEDRATRFAKFIRRQLGYEELTLLHKKLEDIGKTITESSTKIEKRKALSLLTSGDVKKIRQLLKAMCYDMKPAEALKFRKYSNRDLIEKSSNNRNIPKALQIKQYPFKDVWRKLQENVKLINEMDQTHRGLGYIPENPERPTRTEIDNLIKNGIDRLVAIHKRLNQAWDETHKEGAEDGYNDAIMSLNNDISFLESGCGDLPDKIYELNRIQVRYRTLGSSMLALNQNLVLKLARLFENDEEENGHTNKYPDRLNAFIKQVLNHYREKGEEFDIRSTSNSFEVIIHVKDEKGRSFDTTPQQYLNTFRFRLYAVLLKIALAFYYMKENNCLAPIVIDDVFNASDFENSVSLGQFVYSVYDAYQDVLDNKAPLQMIVLTHDEMIVNAFQNGIKWKSKNMAERESRGYSNHENYCIFGRLFPYMEAESVNQETKKSGAYGAFLNLYMEIGS